MKKVLMSLIVFIMLLTTISFAETKAKVNVEAVRIRESASTDSKIVTNAYKDDQVEIIEENGEWSKIKYGENVGYTKTQFLTKIKSSENDEKTTNEAKVDSNNTVSDYSNSQNTDNTLGEQKQETPEEKPVENKEQEEKEKATETAVVEPIVNEELNIGESIVLKSNLKIRRIPSFSNNENAELSEGSVIIVANSIGNWYKISDGTNIGWVVKNKINSNQSSTAPAETSQPVENTVPENTESPKAVENTAVENTTATETPANNTTENTSTQNNFEAKTGVITVETARVRESASTKSEVIGTLDENEVVNIVGEEGEFYKITSKSIKSGYVSKKLVKEKNVTSRSLTTERAEDTVSEEVNEQLTQILNQSNEIVEENIPEAPEAQPVENTSNTSRKNELVEFAKQYLGYSYVSGGHAPETGFDCSGFTRYIYGHFGYTLGATAASQTSLGVEVAREDLQTADLILYYDEGMTKIGHVGIFLGDGNFIHSANPRRGVVIDNLNTNSYYSKRFVTARRIVE